MGKGMKWCFYYYIVGKVRNNWESKTIFLPSCESQGWL